jgi:two-component system, OmpR family, phosphate regulon sensor histidine kinase PhoR
MIRKVSTSNLVRLISIAGIVFLLVLQFVWLRSAYDTVEQEVLEKSRKCLQVALDEELAKRLSNCKHNINLKVNTPIKKEENVVARTQKSFDNKDFNFTLELVMDVNGTPFVLKKLDSVYLCKIKNLFGFIPEYKMELISAKPKSTDSSYSTSKDTILVGQKTDQILLSNSFTSYVKVTFLSPRKMVVQKAQYILIISLLLVFLIGIVLVYQIFEFSKQRAFISFIKDYTRIIAHDLRSPISNIKMMSTLLAQEGNENKVSQSKYNHETINQCNRLLLAIDNILLVAKSERKDFHLEKSNVVWKDFVSNVMEKHLVNKPFQKPVQFNLVATPLDLKATFDTTLMENVLDNLIQNAIKYSDASVEITIQGQAVDNTITISIKDNGLGISETEQKQIFQLFERGVFMSGQKLPGFGIGLNFVQKAVKAHHGKIYVKSEVGVGSEFIIQLPNEG